VKIYFFSTKNQNLKHTKNVLPFRGRGLADFSTILG
jgi:hypothetical protein